MTGRTALPARVWSRRDMIHEAGPLGPDKIQRCTRCGTILKDFRIRGIDFPSDVPGPLSPSVGLEYPEGALVEQTRNYQAMSLGPAPVDCVPAGAGA